MNQSWNIWLYRRAPYPVHESYIRACAGTPDTVRSMEYRGTTARKHYVLRALYSEELNITGPRYSNKVPLQGSGADDPRYCGESWQLTAWQRWYSGWQRLIAPADGNSYKLQVWSTSERTRWTHYEFVVARLKKTKKNRETPRRKLTLEEPNNGRQGAEKNKISREFNTLFVQAATAHTLKKKEESVRYIRCWRFLEYST